MIVAFGRVVWILVTVVAGHEMLDDPDFLLSYSDCGLALVWFAMGVVAMGKQGAKE